MRDDLRNLEKLRALRRRKAEDALHKAQRAHERAKTAHTISGNAMRLRHASKQAAHSNAYDTLNERGADGQLLTALLQDIEAQSDALREAEREHIERWQTVQETDAVRHDSVQAMIHQQSRDRAWLDLAKTMRKEAIRARAVREDDLTEELKSARLCQDTC